MFMFLLFTPSVPHVTLPAQLVKAVVYILTCHISSLRPGTHQSRRNWPPCQRCMQYILCLQRALLLDPGLDQYNPERRERSLILACTSGILRKLEQPLDNENNGEVEMRGYKSGVENAQGEVQRELQDYDNNTWRCFQRGELM